MREEYVTITQELLEKGRSLRGSWTKKQLEILGVKWPLQRGWRYKLVGSSVTRLQAERFVEIRLDLEPVLTLF